MSPPSLPNEAEDKPLGQLALVRRNPWILGISALPLVLALVMSIVIHSAELFFMLLVPHLLILTAALFSLLWTRNAWPREVEGMLGVTSEGVQFGQTLVLRRDQIKAGFVVPRPGKRPIVRLEKKGFSLPTEIRVDDDDAGRQLLRRLDLDVTQTIASFVLPSRMYAIERSDNIFAAVFLAFSIIAVLVMMTGDPTLRFVPPLLVLAPSALFALGLPLTITRVRIGADGIVLRWFVWERFIPYDDIAVIESYEEKRILRAKWAGVHLKLRTGEVVTLPIASVGNVGGPRTRLVTHRLQEAHADHHRGARASAQARLARGERPMLAWVRELRQTGSGAAASHRIAPVPMDRLLELAEDPRTDAVTRASAAVALGATAENDDVRARLRVAARATAAPRLRIAIEKAAETDDEATLAEALAEVEAEAKRSEKIQ